MNSSRAIISGSAGDANGSLSIATTLSAWPRTSTPSQKLPVPSNTASPCLRNRRSRSSRGASPWASNCRPPSARLVALEPLFRVVQCAVARKQAEHAARRHVEQRRDRLEHRVGVARIRRLRHVRRQINEAVLLQAVRTRKRQACYAGQSHARSEVRKVLAHGQRGRRKYPGLKTVVDNSAELGTRRQVASGSIASCAD